MTAFAETLSDRIVKDTQPLFAKIFDRASTLQSNGFIVFDLDSTVFDNRPRQAKILREFGALKKLEPLTHCESHHFVDGWNLTAAVISTGVDPAKAEALYPELKTFWQDRFFTGDYCIDDVPILGAADFLRACELTNARIVYVTGRHEAMRSGTIVCMRKHNFPIPGGGRQVELLMKPTREESDDLFKKTTHEKLAHMGELIAAFDNEPTHINQYATEFPNAFAIHLATDHSGRPVELHPQTLSIRHF